MADSKENPTKQQVGPIQVRRDGIKKELQDLAILVTQTGEEPGLYKEINDYLGATEAAEVKKYAALGEAPKKLYKIPIMDAFMIQAPGFNEDTVELYRLQADRGDGEAQFILGLCYQHGWCVNKDKEIAARYFLQSVKQQHRWTNEALKELGRLPKEVTKWHKFKAELGYAADQVALGTRYKEGLGVEQSREEAIIWYSRAAEQEHLDAVLALEKFSKKEVAECYKNKASKGDPVFQFKLARCYELGHGVERDIKKAVSNYTQSAEHGYAPAQFALGECYEHGRLRMPSNMELAEYWYGKAAKQAHREAQAGLERVRPGIVLAELAKLEAFSTPKEGAEYSISDVILGYDAGFFAEQQRQQQSAASSSVTATMSAEPHPNEAPQPL